MSSVLTWMNLIEELLGTFPAINTPQYADKIGGFENSGQYMVFGVVFRDYSRFLLSESPELRAEIGAFLEKMAQSGDPYIHELLQIQVLSVFIESQQMVDSFWPFLGSKTRRLLWLIAPKKAPAISIPAMTSET
jgi:hypothetical protein